MSNQPRRLRARTHAENSCHNAHLRASTPPTDIKSLFLTPPVKEA
jgi:hypothetical protein